MPFDSAIQEALDNYKSYIDQLYAGAGIVPTYSTATTEIMALPPEKQTSFEVLNCFLRNTNSKYNPMTDNSDYLEILENNIYKAAITAVINESHKIKFSYLVRVFFHTGTLTQNTFRMFLEHDFDDLYDLLTWMIKQKILDNQHIKIAIKNSEEPSQVLNTIVDLYHNSIDVTTYDLKLWAGNPLDKAKALIFLKDNRFLDEGRSIVINSHSPINTAVLLLAFRKKKSLLNRLHQIANQSGSNRTRGEMIDNLLRQTALEKLSQIISTELLFFMTTRNFIPADTAQKFMIAKQFIHQIEQGICGIDLVWDQTMEWSVCTSTSHEISNGCFSARDPDLVLFVRKHRHDSNFESVHRSLYNSKGHQNFCSGMLWRSLSTSRTTFFELPNIRKEDSDMNHAIVKAP